MTSKKIMVIDDSKTIRKLVKASLELMGNYVIGEAKDGLDGIQKITEEEFDLIITDLRMPKMNGLEFISYIKKKASKLSNIPIVVLTTEGGEEDRKKCLELGAVDYIVKPFQPLILQKIVKKLIG